ncbi:MAG TPA: Mur ligase family protein, partial [Chitinophagaceae bacterium]|nr:Mur ligase family protein [Chitinophagaceae bacterium]
MPSPLSSQRIHFIALGGSVMHQLAIALKNKGFEVTGSDDELFEPALTQLAQAGLLPPSPGWDPGRITPGLDAVILGMHARKDNPELQAALRLGVPVYSFPEYIRRVSTGKIRVVVGGSHGKTTVTSMIMHVLREAGKDFDYLVGARLEGFAASVRVSDAPVIICEGDEYPASALEKRPKFHFFQPHIAVITGIAWDHINVFPTFEGYLEQFSIFLEKIEPGGCLIYNSTDPVVTQLVRKGPPAVRLLPYQVPLHHTLDHRTLLEVEGHTAALRVFGDHNLLNSEASRLVCRELGVGTESFLRGISTFQGASRRLEQIASGSGSMIFRDFAHAPSKVRATVRAVHTQFPEKILVAVLELHTYSSLDDRFLPQYHGSLDPAQVAVVYYSPHALELKRLPPLDPESIRKGFDREDL